MNFKYNKVVRLDNLVRYVFSFLGFLIITLFLSDQAFATNGIGEFTGPIDAVMNTITGPVGKSVAIIGMALCGYYFITNKEDISGGAKALLGIVFGICFIAFASPIVNSLFDFTGALI
jgi:type IV secretion system protein VirB2